MPVSGVIGSTIGFALYWPPVLPNTSRSFSSIYSRSLGLDDKDVAVILFQDKVDFVALLS